MYAYVRMLRLILNNTRAIYFLAGNEIFHTCRNSILYLRLYTRLCNVYIMTYTSTQFARMVFFVVFRKKKKNLIYLNPTVRVTIWNCFGDDKFHRDILANFEETIKLFFFTTFHFGEIKINGCNTSRHVSFEFQFSEIIRNNRFEFDRYEN